jgi:hypothetical protein
MLDVASIARALSLTGVRVIVQSRWRVQTAETAAAHSLSQGEGLVGGG